jgi:cytochrome c biogenesis factor
MSLLQSGPGPGWAAWIVLQAAACLTLTVAFALGVRALTTPSGDLQRTRLAGTLPWLRAGFLLLTLAWVGQSLWLTMAWGESWAWDSARNLGLLVWLAYAGVLHMHHVPNLRGRRAVQASLVAWGLLALGLVVVPYLGSQAANLTQNPRGSLE